MQSGIMPLIVDVENENGFVYWQEKSITSNSHGCRKTYQVLNVLIVLLEI